MIPSAQTLECSMSAGVPSLSGLFVSGSSVCSVDLGLFSVLVSLSDVREGSCLIVKGWPFPVALFHTVALSSC